MRRRSLGSKSGVVVVISDIAPNPPGRNYQRNTHSSRCPGTSVWEAKMARDWQKVDESIGGEANFPREDFWGTSWLSEPGCDLPDRLVRNPNG